MNIKYISAKDACKAIKENAVLLDVREEIETSDVWIDMENTIAIPFSNLGKSLDKLPKNKPIIICCAIGIVSKSAAMFLMENKDFTDISVIENGLVAWKLEDLPLKYKNEIPFECKCCYGDKNED